MLSATIRPWAKEEVDYAQEVPAEDATVEKTAFVQNTIPLQDCELFNRFSSYTRLRKVMVYYLRFMTKLARQCHLTLTLQFTPDVGPEITVAELEQSAHHLCRMTQVALLGEEIKRISNQAELQKGHSLANLSPILRNGLLCVGGRLRYANISENRKHPIILPATSRLVALLIDYMHQKMFHGGIHLIATHLRQLYWIPRLKVVINARLRRCIVCLRYGAETAFQRMADLPAARVNQCRSFEEAGLDYAGPFPIKASRHRGNYSYKGYFAIFVCMATKAVHLEAVSSYDTKSFLAAFRRFISRRGPCRHLYSDRGTNFVGADAELRRLHSQESGFYKSICAQLPTRRLRHYRSGLRALRRGRRPRQRGSVAQPEQHDLSASRAASRRGAGEIHSRAAEQGRGGARRQALLPDHMSGEEVPSARQQFEGGDRADAFQGARIPDGRARPARHVLQSESSLGLRKLSARAVRVLVAARGAAQPGARRHRHDLRESVGAVVILVEQVEDQPGVHPAQDGVKDEVNTSTTYCSGIVGAVDVHQPSFGYNLSLHLVVLTVNARLILNLFYQDDNGAIRFPKIVSMPSSSRLSCSSSCHQYSDGSSG
ncbi:unnamed protein product [Trichogramma brassicae]|uniref:Integrase zinc-binding domain-containing protein n=1 Tax=Trichogramma brassicae TaxID=86971 RepID=A0A6H5J2P0_9HYME|nr:unnamed protein product [Trichogramma brassicae]